MQRKNIYLCSAVLVLAVLLGAYWCYSHRQPATQVPDTRTTAEPLESLGSPLFRDVTAHSGVDFTYHNGQEANQYSILETLGGGVGLIDYDGDGLLDIFVTGGGYFDGPDKHDIKGYPSRLYKNLGNWKFRDVTHEVGLDQPVFYTHGCAVADYDGDGWPDLLVTGFDRLVLYHNVPDKQAPGGRRFVDVTRQAGLHQDRGWSTGAAWADLDGDGRPDLYVCHYVDWSWKKNPPCYDSGHRQVCSPRLFEALPHKLYHNEAGVMVEGRGARGPASLVPRPSLLTPVFRDVSEKAGLNQPHVLKNSKGLGVLILSLNNERGLPDIYVADDTADNLLFANHGDMKFEEVSIPSGATRDELGQPNGSMGVDAADYDDSGLASLWVTNFEHEHHALYRQQGRGSYRHATMESGLGFIDMMYVGWGTGFVDLDNDGLEDLVIIHGGLSSYSREPLHPAVLALNEGNARFKDVTARGGSYFRARHQGRGLALGDLDNDGRVDLVISHINEPLVILRNESDSGHHWLGVELATRDHRDVVGAVLKLEGDGFTRTRFTKGGGSYLSSSDRRIVFGLGKAEKAGRLTVHWPSGEPRVQVWSDLAIDRYHRLVQGQGPKS
jgi:hypothetical protein